MSELRPTGSGPRPLVALIPFTRRRIYDFRPGGRSASAIGGHLGTVRMINIVRGIRSRRSCLCSVFGGRKYVRFEFGVYFVLYVM